METTSDRTPQFDSRGSNMNLKRVNVTVYEKCVVVRKHGHSKGLIIEKNTLKAGECRPAVTS